jgi:hypothetical protein
MHRRLLTALPLALVTLLAAGTPALAADDMCQPKLAAELKEQGVEWSTLQDQDWVPETQSDKRGQEIVSGYQFFARPETCTEGKLFARMDQDCRITQIFTRGGCQVGSVRAK